MTDASERNPLRQTLVEFRVIQLEGIDGGAHKRRRDGIAVDAVPAPLAGELPRVQVINADGSIVT